MASVHSFRQFVNERLTAAADEIFGIFAKTIIIYEEEIDRQRKLLDDVLKPDVKLHWKEPSVCNEDVLTEKKLCNQERNPCREENCAAQDGEPRVPKLETDVRLRSCEGGENAPQQTERAADDEEEEALANISVVVIKSEFDRKCSAVSESNSNCYHSPNSDTAKTQTRQRGKRKIAHPKVKTEKQHFTCLFCNEEFREFLDLKSHLRTHRGGKCFKCDTCGEVFSQKALVKSHMMTHSDMKHFTCRHCGKDFNFQSSCINHMKTHSDEKLHICGTCGKSFSRSTDLRRHNRTHTGEKPYSCVHCGREFSHHSSLTNHVRVHTGEKPYQCSWCGKRFAISATLKIHTRVHTGERPYMCNICGKNFAHNTGLTFHRKAHARENEEI